MFMLFVISGSKMVGVLNFDSYYQIFQYKNFCLHNLINIKCDHSLNVNTGFTRLVGKK